MPDVQVRIFHPSASPVLGAVDGLGHLFFVWGNVTGVDAGLATDTVLEILGEDPMNPHPNFQWFPLQRWLAGWYPSLFAYAVYWYDNGPLPNGPFTVRVTALDAGAGPLNSAQVMNLSAVRTFLPLKKQGG
jgi:hypothetical protein